MAMHCVSCSHDIDLSESEEGSDNICNGGNEREGEGSDRGTRPLWSVAMNRKTVECVD